MPSRYHIETAPVPSRRPHIGKHGIVDWREDCARCHDCVKKACVYDRYRHEADYIRGLKDDEELYYGCMGCFSCVQNCTKGLLRLAKNPEYEALGNTYWTPEIIATTWLQAETAKIPVSGAGYRGRFAGSGFDAMWTDMSEIVRPTRDGIHGREYISTSVDVGRKPPFLALDTGEPAATPPLISLPMPLVIDLASPVHALPRLDPLLEQVAANTGLIAIMDSRHRPADAAHLEHIAFFFGPYSPPVPGKLLKKTRLAEVADGPAAEERIAALKKVNPELVISLRVELNEAGLRRATELAARETTEVIHVVAGANGDELGARTPRFIKDMLRELDGKLVDAGIRDEVTIMAGGGIALPEHMAKAIICGADLVTINLPLLIALECRLCDGCGADTRCPARLEHVDQAYGVGRMTNLIAAWHDQLIELMGAMGIREARRLRGEVGRAMFIEDLEREAFGTLFSTPAAG